MLRRFGPFIFVGLWSGGFTAVRLGLDHAEPLTLQALRYLVVVAGLLPLAALLRLRPPRAPLMELLPFVFVCGAALLVPLALWREPEGRVGPGAWWHAAFIGLVAAPVGTWATVEAGRHLNAVLASLGFLLVPLLGVALATTWLGEPLGWDLLLGGALIVMSVALAAKG